MDTKTNNDAVTYALVSDCTPNRATVVMLGTLDECELAYSDADQQIVPVAPGDVHVLSIGQRVHMWHDGSRRVVGE